MYYYIVFLNKGLRNSVKVTYRRSTYRNTGYKNCVNYKGGII